MGKITVVKKGLALALSCLMTSALLYAAGPVTPAAASEPPTYRIDWFNTKQTVDGIGAAEASWTWLMYQMPEETREEIMRLCFDPDEGIGLSIYRGEIGGGVETDTWTGDCTHEPVQGERNWEAGWMLRDIAKTAVRCGGLENNVKVLLTVWSPPAWMKMGTPEYEIAQDNGVKGGILNPAHYQDYANYLADYIAYCETTEGLPIEVISPANEPNGNQLGWASCHWDPADMADFVGNYLGPTLDARGLRTKITAAESGDWGEEVGVEGNPSKGSYVDALLGAAASKKHLDIVSAHLYGSNPLDAPFPKTQAAGKRLWITEASLNGHPDSGMDAATYWAGVIHDSFTEAGVNAWTWWAIAMNAENSGDQGQALIAVDDAQSGSYRIRKTLWALGNYSKFIRPGYTRMEAQQNTVPAGVKVSAFRPVQGVRPDHADDLGDDFVVVAVNESDTPATFRIQSTNNDGNVTGQSVTPYLTDAEHDLQKMNAVTLDGMVTLPPKSVVTFVTEDEPLPVNMLTNGGFEAATLQKWVTTGAAVQIVTQPVNYGRAALCVEGEGSLSQDLWLLPNQEYTLSFYARTEGADAGSLLQIITPGGAGQLPEPLLPQPVDVSGPDDGWTRYEATFRSGSRENATLLFSNESARATVYLDDFMLTGAASQRLRNGDLNDKGKGDWTIYPPVQWLTDGIGAHEGAGYLWVNNPDDTWPQFSSGSVSLSPDTDYVLTFWAAATGYPGEVGVKGGPVNNTVNPFRRGKDNWYPYTIPFHSGPDGVYVSVQARGDGYYDDFQIWGPVIPGEGQTGTVTYQAVDEDTGLPIQDDRVMEGKIGERYTSPYSVEKPEIANYQFQRVEGYPETGVYGADKLVRYVYKQNQGTVRVEYRDVDSTREIRQAVVLSGGIGTPYDVSALAGEIPGYLYLESFGPPAGTYEDLPQTVIFYYQGRSGTVHIDFREEESDRLIADSAVLQGIVGRHYESPYLRTAREIPGYSYLRAEGPETGQYSDTPLFITYWYRSSRHSITATSGNGGSISPSGTIWVTSGDAVTFEIRPRAGYRASRLLVDGEERAVPSGGRYTFQTVTSDRTIEAFFTAAPVFWAPSAPAASYHTIEATATAGGKISPEGSCTVKEFEDMEFRLIPDEGYRVEQVLVDQAGLPPPEDGVYVFRGVDHSQSIHVTFAKKEPRNEAALTPPVAITQNPRTGDNGASFRLFLSLGGGAGLLAAASKRLQKKKGGLTGWKA